MKYRAKLISENISLARGGMLAAVAACIAVWSALGAHPMVLLLAGASLGLAFFTFQSSRQPLILVGAFLLAAILLPPFYADAFGGTPIYVPALLTPVGLLIILLRFPDFKLRRDPVAWGLLVFLLGTGLSLPFGWWLSGTQAGNQGFLRWLMLAQTGLIYVLVRGGARQLETRAERALISVLVIAAVLTAAYGILDFVWPVPISHPAADQFIWLRTSILRRAQGVFYEAGNFANLCVFFLVLAMAAILAKRERDLGVKLPLLMVFTGILSLAVFVSFTRSAWISVLVALAAFTGAFREVRWRRIGWLIVVTGAPVLLLPFYFQSLWDYLVSARLGNLARLFTDPNLASSGRFEMWELVSSIVASHPQFLIFGIGYKTLSITRLFHRPIITDNGFLNLLLECGLVGLSGFLVFSVAIIKTFLRASRVRRGTTAFWAAVLFAFWCGECAQMMAVDAYTYWRNFAVFAASMGLVMNRLDREDSGSEFVAH